MTDSSNETHRPELLHEETEQVYKKYVKENDYPQWVGAFSEEERLAQFEEDLEAGNTVPILLTFIAAIGLIMAAILLSYVTWVM
jgi:hypothetical protein